MQVVTNKTWEDVKVVRFFVFYSMLVYTYVVCAQSHTIGRLPVTSMIKIRVIRANSHGPDHISEPLKLYAAEVKNILVSPDLTTCVHVEAGNSNFTSRLCFCVLIINCHNFVKL